jgi:hypothetical protein
VTCSAAALPIGGSSGMDMVVTSGGGGPSHRCARPREDDGLAS